LAKAIERYAADDTLRYKHGLEASVAAGDCSQSMYGLRYSVALRRLLR